MKNILIIIATIIVLAGLGILVLWLLASYLDIGNVNTTNSDIAFQAITTFDECIIAGYPILESYPPQCKTPDGRSFTKDMGNQLEKVDLIRVTNPLPNQEVASPLNIEGQARGSWYFEGVFPITLYDEKNEIMGTATGQAQADWATEDFVPFKATLEFSDPKTERGNLILENDNPSGLPEYSEALRIPVIFTQDLLQINESPTI